MNQPLSPEELEILSTKATELLWLLKLGDSFRFERLSGGKNNRVYRALENSKAVVLKWYFHHESDQRDRLVAEWSFYEWANKHANEFVADRLGFDGTNRFAVYSMLNGHRIDRDDVDAKHIDQAIAFVRRLNQYRNRSKSDGLTNASEACFSIRQHYDCITARVDRLREIETDTDVQRQALDFVQTTLSTSLADAFDQLHIWSAAEKVDMSLPITGEQRCVSPSDFGFHNALQDENGKLTFYDFEYAGWDDPAKLLCDFYCQPEVPAPRETWNAFADLTAELAGDTPRERQRQALLFPLYQVKWCCILLNEFLPAAKERRQFAANKEVDLASQLQKAKQLAEQIVVD